MDFLAGATIVLALFTGALAWVTYDVGIRRPGRMRPVLSLSAGGVFPEKTESGHVFHYARLLVENAPGGDAALGVQVTLARLTGRYVSVSPLVAHAWTHAPRKETRKDIPPGSRRYVDFLQSAEQASSADLCLNPKPGNPWWHLTVGIYDALLEVSAGNAPAASYRVRFVLAAGRPRILSVAPMRSGG